MKLCKQLPALPEGPPKEAPGGTLTKRINLAFPTQRQQRGSRALPGKGNEQVLDWQVLKSPSPAKLWGLHQHWWQDLGGATPAITARLALICSSWKGVPASEIVVSQNMNSVM